jgi:cation diffusion facilitator family transporter
MKKESTTDNEKNRVAVASLLVAILLTFFKAVVGFATGSLGIISEAMHSAMDVFAAGLTAFSVRLSSKPPDEKHNFGHGKIENISALIEGLILVATCVWIVWEAVERLTGKETHIVVNFWGFFVVIFAIIVDLNRTKILSKMAKKHKSQALEADALHFSSDILSSGVVLLGLILTYFNIHTADSIAALFVSMIVLYMSVKLSLRAIDELLDRAPVELKKDVEGIITGISEVKYVHDIKIRTSGSTTFIDLNIHLDPNLTIEEAHQIAHRVENEIKKAYSNCQIHIHQEPESKHE